MGGCGSGRWRERGATRCEDMHCIDLAVLNRGRPLQDYQCGILHWSRGGRRTGSVSYMVLPQALRLEYKVQRYGEEAWTSIKEEIPFSWTGTAFGGRRRWLRCPTCQRRCRGLFGGERFRCRRCYRLTYQSQYDPPHERAQSRAQNVRIKLGGSGSMRDRFPPKPKGMHRQTYWRLWAQDNDALEGWVTGSMAWLERLRQGRR